MNKEKEKLMQELFGKARNLDINDQRDVLIDSTKELQDIIEMNSRNLTSLKEVADEKTYSKISEEVASDFSLSQLLSDLKKDYDIPEVATVINDNKQLADIFADVATSIKQEVLGQDTAVDAMVTAFHRPHLAGHDAMKIAATIILTGHKGSGRHSLVKAISRAVKAKGLLTVSDYSTIDLSRYQSATQETLFLQDLYVALSDPKGIIVFDEAMATYPIYGRMLAGLSANGKITLNKRYIFSNGQLLSAGEGLNKGVIDHLDGNGKILIFVIEGNPSKLSDIFGKSFMDSVDDIVTMGSLDTTSIDKITTKLSDDLKAKCLSQLDIKVILTDNVISHIARGYDEDEGVYSLLRSVDKLYEEIVDIALANSDIDAITIDKTDKLIATYGSKTIEVVIDEDKKAERAAIQKELDAIIGLDKVKEYLLSLEDHIRVSKIRKAKGLKTAEMTKHMIFTGDPGTGKTTIARLVSRLMKVTGILRQGQLVEVTRADLVAKYVGQTAPQTMAVIESALGGVLFIDEAYSLYRGKDDTFGLEAIDTLVKAMEDYRDDFIVILAGYSKEMASFLEANSGLKSRFANIIHFENYTADELVAITVSIAEGKDYRISKEALDVLKDYYTEVQSRHDATSGNGRMARNMVEEAILNHSRRVLKDTTAAIDVLMKEDFDFEVGR